MLFFGAGASAASDFALPLMKNFFIGGIDKDKFPNLLRFITDYFPNLKLENLNLEQVITFLELSIDKFGSFGNEVSGSLYDARKQFRQFVHARLNYAPINSKNWCEKHKVLLSKLNNDFDSIITLNYDLVIENTLHEIQKHWKPEDSQILLRQRMLLESTTKLSGGDRPTMYAKHKTFGHLLKLHGSINWYYCPKKQCTHNQAFYPDWFETAEVKTFPGDLCLACGSPLVPVIVSPTMNKSFLEFPKLGFLWGLAFREISLAKHIVLIGVSFALSDYYLQWLLKSALALQKDKPTIEVVNINDDTCKTIEETTGITPKYRGDFDTYIKGL